MNHVTISGMLGKDPEIRTLTGGMTKAEFSVANKIWTKSGEKTTWIQVRVIGKRAEAAQQNLRKGMKVWVEGAWMQDEWLDKGTQTKRRLDYLFAASVEWDGRGASTTRDAQPEAGRPDDDEEGY